jgi:TatD DNase family protein
MYIDTHTHIYTEEFDTDRAAVIERAVAAGAEALLLPNIDEASLAPLLALCHAYPTLCYPMIGLHPTELPERPADVLQRMETLLQRHHVDDATPSFIGIGEVGIDLYWDDTRRSEQIDVFRQQAEWAVRYHLPLIVHSRAAHRDLVDTLRPLAHDLVGIFHCFGGDSDEAHELLSTFPGFTLGIGGTVTFKKSPLPAVLRDAVPLTRLVVETDAPYLSPTPLRGRRNEPANIPLVIDKLADIYALPAADIARQTVATTRRLFPTLPAPPSPPPC